MAAASVQCRRIRCVLPKVWDPDPFLNDPVSHAAAILLETHVAPVMHPVPDHRPVVAWHPTSGRPATRPGPGACVPASRGVIGSGGPFLRSCALLRLRRFGSGRPRGDPLAPGRRRGLRIADLRCRGAPSHLWNQWIWKTGTDPAKPWFSCSLDSLSVSPARVFFRASATLPRLPCPPLWIAPASRPALASSRPDRCPRDSRRRGPIAVARGGRRVFPLRPRLRGRPAGPADVGRVQHPARVAFQPVERVAAPRADA